MRFLIQFLDRYLEEVLAGSALLVMSVLVFTQVLMRYLFHAPMSWSDEVAVYCMVWSVYISAVWAVRERAHIRVMNLVYLLPKSISMVFIVLSDLIWLLLCGLIAWQGVVLEHSLWQRQFISPVLGIDQKWPYMIVTLGFVLMMFRILQCYFLWFRKGGKGLPTQLPTENGQ